MEKKPKVSIIIPSYNNGKYIGSAISSALNQTYPNIEVIIVDDNSNDGTKEILNELINSNLICIFNKNNVGASASKNIAIRRSSGEYIAILDSDDVYSKQKIEAQINCFEKLELTNSKIGLIYCGIKHIDDNCNVLRKILPKGKGWSGVIHGEFIGATPLIKKECFEKAGMFDENLRYFEDRDLYYRIHKCGYSFGYIEKPLYLYRNHSTNISKNSELYLKNIDLFYRKYLSLPEYKYDKKIRSQYYIQKGFALLKHKSPSAIYYLILSLIWNPLILFEYILKRLSK
ncbi:MAG TPA: glycosyltransferase [Methanosarcinaceae archaeon]|nr:glycosyltransferase [Methanosarcinaceae archaeon]